MSLTNLVLLQNSALLGPAGQAIPVDIQCELGKVNFMYFFSPHLSTGFIITIDTYFVFSSLHYLQTSQMSLNSLLAH